MMSASRSTTGVDQGGRRAREFPPVPEPLPIPVPDAHTHLDMTVGEYQACQEPFGPATIERAVELASTVGVDRLVQVGVDVSSSRWSVAVAAEHAAIVATVALHPNEAPRLAKSGGPEALAEAFQEIEKLAEHPRVRGIGETGLDYFRTGADGRAAQHESFLAHIELAKRVGKPLVIHDRDAHEDVLRVLDAAGAPQTVVMHCFSGDGEFAKECALRGYLLSFAGNVTFRSAEALRSALAVTPPEQLLVETDAPFLTPAPHRGRPNASYLIPLTVRAIAHELDRSVEWLCERLSGNAERVFGPWRAATPRA